MTNKQGLLIVAHGSKSDIANSEFDQIVAHTASQTSDYVVKGAHMEISHPSIPEAIPLFAEEGVKQIIVVPYFLFNGKHILKDIPQILKETQVNFPQVTIILAKPFGFEPSLAHLVIKRAIETHQQQQ